MAKLVYIRALSLRYILIICKANDDDKNMRLKFDQHDNHPLLVDNLDLHK